MINGIPSSKIINTNIRNSLKQIKINEKNKDEMITKVKDNETKKVSNNIILNIEVNKNQAPIHLYNKFEKRIFQ